MLRVARLSSDGVCACQFEVAVGGNRWYMIIGVEMSGGLGSACAGIGAYHMVGWNDSPLIGCPVGGGLLFVLRAVLLSCHWPLLSRGAIQRRTVGRSAALSANTLDANVITNDQPREHRPAT